MGPQNEYRVENQNGESSRLHLLLTLNKKISYYYFGVRKISYQHFFRLTINEQYFVLSKIPENVFKNKKQLQ